MSKLRFRISMSLDGFVAGAHAADPERVVHALDGIGDDLHGLELVRTVATPKVTHLKFAR